jgi:hypothetical protein
MTEITVQYKSIVKPGNNMRRAVTVRLASLVLTPCIAWCQAVPIPHDPQAERENIEYSGKSRFVFRFKDPNLAVSWFNDGAATQNPLMSCSLVIEIPISRLETIFAANCLTRHGSETVQVCQDTGVGESKLLPSSTTDATKSALLTFLATWCPGG